MNNQDAQILSENQLSRIEELDLNEESIKAIHEQNDNYNKSICEGLK